jgi:asparagine synthase (glutamine-hydrolysing)
MEFIYKKLSLYNRLELLDALDLSYTYSDETIVLSAYKKWGETFLDHLNGDYAFALYYSEKKEYLLARDALGICALYYTEYEGRYYFSNDLDELFDTSKIDRVPSIKSVKGMLEHNSVEYDETMYEGVYRVPPGHYIKIKDSSVKYFRYWYPEDIEIDHEITQGEAIKNFTILFQQAIEHRISNDASTAYELSGGLDSSSIVSIKKHQDPKAIVDTYSMAFSGLSCDESKYILSVEEKYHLHTNYLQLSTLDYKYKFNFEYNYTVSPHWPITSTFTMYVPMMERMKEMGKKVIITGQGGDHVLSGHCDMISDLLKRFEFEKIYNEFRALRKGHLAYFARCALWPLLSLTQKKIIKKVFFGRSINGSNVPFKDLFSLGKIRDRSKKFDIGLLVSPSQSTNMDAAIFHVFEKIYDVEFKHPFYDKELVEFMLSLPPEFKYSKGYHKMLLRHSMKEILPDMIRFRHDKAEFSEVLRQQLEALDLKALFSRSKLLQYNLITLSEIEKLLNAYHSKNDEQIVHLWQVANVEFWFQKQRVK